MKIKLNQHASGPNGMFRLGTVVEVDDKTGEWLIKTKQGQKAEGQFPNAPILKGSLPEDIDASIEALKTPQERTVSFLVSDIEKNLEELKNRIGNT